MGRLQDICDAIWTAETRTLKEGAQIESPATLLETICKACWTNATRELTADPLTLADDTADITAPFEVDDPVDTAAATGGTPPYSYRIISQVRTV
jgi:hypothetical protein